MKEALADKKAVPFRMPPGIKLVRVNLRPAQPPGGAGRDRARRSSRARSPTSVVEVTEAWRLAEDGRCRRSRWRPPPRPRRQRPSAAPRGAAEPARGSRHTTAV